MSEEIRKKIEEQAEDRYAPRSYQSVFIEGAEFGYQLGYEEAMRELTRQVIEANSVKPIFDRAAIPYQLCPKCNGNKWTKNKTVRLYFSVKKPKNATG